jgi:hypothetical protein
VSILHGIDPGGLAGKLRVLVGAAAALCTPAAFSSGVMEPLYVRNLSPVGGLLGLPSQRDAHPTAAGEVQAALHGSVASHYINDSSSDEFLNLDGETLRLALDLRYGLTERWDVQLEVPWLDQSGGELDRLIDDWHDLWGMSDGGRSDVPRDRLDYRYISRDGSFSLLDDASGIGDITLSTTYAFHRGDDAAASIVLGYKFGTGDADDFTGSGADDAWIALRFSGDQLSDLPLTWHGQVGYLRAGEGDLIEEFQHRDFWFAGLSMDWRFAERWSVILQVDGHRAPFDSDITALGDDAVLGTVGARWHFADKWSVDLSVVEDLRVETAADVTFQASLRYKIPD